MTSKGGQIVRIWSGYGTEAGVDRYCREHFPKSVLPDLLSIKGFVEAKVLTRAVGGETEVVVATTWDSIDSVKAFAGDDYDRAVVEPAVRQLLTRFDDHVTHFTLALTTPAGSFQHQPKEEEAEPMTKGQLRPYALKAGEGWTYNFGIDFTVKTGELGRAPRLAFVEFTTRAGEEPPDHADETEDEIFYVLEGALTIRCGDETFEVKDGGFVFLPRGVEHGYQIRGKDHVRLLVRTSPAQEDAEGGWGGFVAEFEAQGELRGSPPGFS